MKSIVWKNVARTMAFGCAVVWAISAGAQLTNEDSLSQEDKKIEEIRERLKSTTDVNKKIDLMTSILEVARLAGNYTQGAHYADSLEKMITHSPHSLEKAEAYLEIGKFNSDQSYYEISEKYYQKLLETAKALPEKQADRMINLVLMAQAYNCFQMEELNKSMELYAKACIYFEREKDVAILIKAYTGISTILMVFRTPMKLGTEEYAKATERIDSYNLKIMGMEEQTDNKILKSDCCNSYALYLMNKKQFDEAKVYLEKVHRYSTEANYPRGILAYWGNMGWIDEQENRIDQAIANYKKAYEISMELRNYNQAVLSLSNIGFTALKYDKIDIAKEYSVMGLELSEKYKLKDNQWRFLENLSTIAAHEKRFEEAYNLYMQAADIYFAFYREENNKQVNHYIARYEAVQKEMKIKEMEDNDIIQQDKIQQRSMLLITSLVIIVLFLIGVVFYRHYIRQKAILSEQRIRQLEQEKQLTATQAVLDGETAERTRLARDLHDGLGGMLSVIKLNLNNMKQGVMLENVDMQRFNAALKMLDDSIGELRRVSHNMMPDSLSRYGLKAALTDFCNSVMGAEFNYFGSDDRLEPKLEVVIYRTVHELVNNVLKHAGATKIVIQLVQEPERIAVMVQDDGCGFDTAAESPGTGLKNIRNRVAAYNGRMDIYSKLGEGTEVNVEFIFS